MLRIFRFSFLGVLLVLLTVTSLLWLDSRRGDGNGIVAGLYLARWQAPLAWLTLALGVVLALRSRRKWLQNATIYVLMTVLTVAALEGVCGWLLRRQATRLPKLEGPVHSMQTDPVLGYKPHSDTILTGIRTKNGVPLYSIRFQTDSNHLRVTPGINPAAASRYALFFGCSMTFGEGVESNQTIPYYFGQAEPIFRPYNLAFSGYGPHQMLARLQHDSLRRFVTQSTGAAYYVFIPDHVNRVIQSLTNYGYNRGNAPYFYLDGSDSLRYGGLFREGRKTRNAVYELLSRSNVLKLFKIGYPFRLGPADYQLTAEVLAASARAYENQFGNDRFYVVLYPGTPPLPDLVARLRARNVKILDYSRLFDPLRKGYSIPDDEHPTPLANRVLVAQLVKDLPRLPNSTPLDFNSVTNKKTN